MPSASSSPGTLGLYINSFTMSSSSTNPYKQLLGVDGYGNYSLGNKLTDLFNYTNQFGYNYAIFYDMTGSAFTDNRASETFRTTANRGVHLLDAIMPLAHAAGLVDRAVVCDVNFHEMNAVGVFSPWDGIAQIKKVIAYNQSVSYDPTKAFTKIVTETEFWNFHYKEVAPGDGGSVPMAGTVRTLNSTSGGYSRGEVRSTTVPDFTVLGIGVNDLLEVNNEWRQVVSVTSSAIYVDRPWTVPTINQPWSHYLDDDTVDYETYLYRIGKMADYIATYGSGEEIELYVANPSFTFKGSRPAGVPDQLKRLYQAGVSKILLTAYQRIPSFDSGNSGASMDNNYGSAPSGGYRKISDDIAAEGVPRDVGVIISVESATFNNANGCPNGINTNNNFSGYIMEGRSLLPHSASTDFKGVDPGGLTTACVCCPAGLVRPNITYNPLNMDEIWQYIAETPPSGGVCPACYAPTLADTFNEVIAAGGTRGTNLDNNITFDTLIVFDQEFMRQLIITPAVAFTVSETQTNISCNGLTDGAAAVSALGGVAPFTYEWQSWDGFSWNTFEGPGSPLYTVSGLAAGDYRCKVTDDAATVVTSATITITEPAIVNFNHSETDANCAGDNGLITIDTPTGGSSSSYSYSVVPVGDPPVWSGITSYTLPAGTYDVYVVSGDPSLGCYTILPAIINSGASFTITATQTNATCNLGLGSLTTTPSVAGSYTYNLYNSAPTLIQSNSTGIFNNVSAGAYTIIATNSLGCTSNTLSKTITEPTAVTASGTSTDPTCYLGTDGSITIIAGGGSGVYSYFIQYPSGVTLNNGSGIFTGLGPLTYDYYVQDNLGCQSNIGSITISNPSQITPVYEVIQISEDLAIGGSITLNYISGGTNPYSYLWNTGETTESLSNLVSGTYTVTITDDNDCQVVQSFTIRVECTELSYDSYKVQIYKAQCCAGKLAKKYVKFMQQGREDLAFPVMQDITTLTLILNAIKCDDNPGDQSCFTCDEMITLLENIKNICSCDCCQDQDGDQVTVTFNPESGQLDIIE